MELRPLHPEMILAGRAMTVLGQDLPSREQPLSDPYGLLFESLDDLKTDEIYVYTGGTPEYAIWGGLMSTRAMKLGARGALIDGCYRDSKEILSLGFPIFGRGAYAPDQQSRGIISDYRCPITIGQVAIENGDFIFGDMDGVLSIPNSMIDSVLEVAYEKLQTENQLRKALERGMSAREAFDRFGIF